MNRSDASAPSTFRASRVTSGPMPSPGTTAIRIGRLALRFEREKRREQLAAVREAVRAVPRARPHEDRDLPLAEERGVWPRVVGVALEPRDEDVVADVRPPPRRERVERGAEPVPLRGRRR